MLINFANNKRQRERTYEGQPHGDQMKPLFIIQRIGWNKIRFKR